MIEVALGTGVVIEMAIHGMDATAAEMKYLTMFSALEPEPDAKITSRIMDKLS